MDAVFDYLKSQNISDMMIEIGGEVRVKGQNAQGKLWAIAIERPKLSADAREEFNWVIDLDNQAMATSGDYRSYFEIDGNIFSHEIDPRTGYPSRTGVASATVIAPKCTDADALATALMLMPITDGLKLVESIPKTEAFIIIRQPEDRFTYRQSSGEGDGHLCADHSGLARAQSHVSVCGQATSAAFSKGVDQGCSQSTI